MTLRYFDGFDAYNDDFSTLPPSVNIRLTDATPDASAEFDATRSRWGVGKAYYLGSSSTAQLLSSVPALGFNTGTAKADGYHTIVGFAYKPELDTSVLPRVGIAAWTNSSGGQICGLALSSVGYLLLIGAAGVSGFSNAPSIVASAVSPIPNDEWAWIECEQWNPNSADGNTAIFKCWVNGSLVIDWTGNLPIDGPMSGTYDVVDVILGASQVPSLSIAGDRNYAWGGPCIFDDFYMIVVDAVAPFARLGDARVDTFYPTSENSNTGYARTGGSNVATAVGHGSIDGDSSYYEADSVSDIVTFDSTDTMSAIPGTIHGVTVNHVTRKTQALDRTLATVVKQGATVYPNANEQAVSSSYGQYSDVLVAQPAGGAWTKTTVEAAAFGVKITE
jgi:uncharacterized glyoxalase superfamily protein PhnB